MSTDNLRGNTTPPQAPAPILIEDTRNKVGKHRNVASYCARRGIQLVRQCLDVGDYMLPNGTVSVDTKRNLDEVAMNLLNRSHRDSKRFWAEVRKAHDTGIKLIILVEHGPDIKTVQDVPKWRSQYSRITGRRLIDEMLRAELAYGVRWVFCDKRSTGRVLWDILQTEGR